MNDWITNLMEQFGYLGIFFMMTIENIFPPIPSEIVLPFSGFMTTYTSMSLMGVLFYSTAGSLIGAMVLFGIGGFLDVEKLDRLIDRWGPLLKIKKGNLRKAESWFEKYGHWTVFFCRMIPLVRSLISLPAGMARMKLIPFLSFTLCGTLLWNLVLISLGAALGESWETVSGVMKVYSAFIYFALAAGLLIFFFFYFTRKRIRKV